MKKVLVTGGGGFIGGYVLEELVSKGYEPIIFDHHDRRNYPVKCELFLGDVRDEVAVTEAMAHCDGWIHLAAVLGTQETINNPRPAALSNLLGGINILEAAAQYNLPGAYICVGNHWMNNTYSITKTMVERFVDMFNQNRGTKVNMVRAVNAYGPRQLAAAPFAHGKVRKITPSFICRALLSMPIEVYGDGEQVSDMVYVRDVAKALVLSLEAAANDNVFDKVVEIGPEDNQTVNQVAAAVRDLCYVYTNEKVPIEHLPMRPGEKPGDRVTADTSTLELIGMKASDLVPLDVGMAQTVTYFADTKGKDWNV